MLKFERLYCTCYSMRTAASFFSFFQQSYKGQISLQTLLAHLFHVQIWQSKHLSNYIPICDGPIKRVWSSWSGKVLRVFEGTIWPCISILTFEERDSLTNLHYVMYLSNPLQVNAIHCAPWPIIKIQIKHCIYKKNTKQLLLYLSLCVVLNRERNPFFRLEMHELLTLTVQNM